MNPLLSKVKLPGRVFTLPSKGLFYKPGEVLSESVRDGEIQVKPMSGLTEVKLRSADLLLSGKIIQEVCQECVPEILHPEKLITKDVDALFVFLVMSTYGSQKRIASIHDCMAAKPHDYEISLDNIVMNPRNECLNHKDMLFSVELDNGQRVILKPLQFQESLDLTLMRHEIAQKEIDRVPITTNELDDLYIMDMLSVIEAVEDVVDEKPIRITDRKMIAEWARILSKKQIDMIVKGANGSASWGFEFDVTLTCRDCGEQYQHSLELNPVNFFSG